MTTFRFSQVDVFSTGPLTGNPVAVLHAADALADEQMAAFARWTNLSETTFLCEPTDTAADYRLRIFTPGGELSFAGHPTLGSAHAWLAAGGSPAGTDIVQQCGIGLVHLRRTAGRLAFAAPPLLRGGPVDDVTLVRVLAALGIAVDDVVDSHWVDNGPGFLGIRLGSADQVLAVRPDFVALGEVRVGLIGPLPQSGPADFEVRAFVPGLGVPEDPVTGSLNAGLAVWLIHSGAVPPNYTVRQGTVLGRSGLVSVTTDDAGRIWVGGACRSIVTGSADL